MFDFKFQLCDRFHISILCSTFCFDFVFDFMFDFMFQPTRVNVSTDSTFCFNFDLYYRSFWTIEPCFYQVFFSFGSLVVTFYQEHIVVFCVVLLIFWCFIWF